MADQKILRRRKEKNRRDKRGKIMFCIQMWSNYKVLQMEAFSRQNDGVTTKQKM